MPATIGIWKLALGTNLVHLTMKRGRFIYKEGEVGPLPANDCTMMSQHGVCEAQKKAGRPDGRPACHYFTGSSYLTNTEMVALTVWPPGP